MLANSNWEHPSLITLESFVDRRGELVVGEFGKQIPFEINRFFFVSNVPSGEPRGFHAHKECHQFLVCVNGNVTTDFDNGYQKSTVVLEQPDLGLYMPPMTWGAQYSYSPGAILLVLASHAYDPDDYINDYEVFKNEILKMN